MTEEIAHDVFIDLIEYADGHCESIIGNNVNDEVFMRDSTPKEIKFFRKPVPATTSIRTLNSIFST
tara:strand:+ start:2474 stop:2671 length:198 start_codon:yes stop_codon:yes gene_type:complete